MQPEQIDRLAAEISNLQESLRKLTNDLVAIRTRIHERDPNDPLLEPINDDPDRYDPD